jgi:hypothetical protein
MKKLLYVLLWATTSTLTMNNVTTINNNPGELPAPSSFTLSLSYLPSSNGSSSMMESLRVTTERHKDNPVELCSLDEIKIFVPQLFSSKFQLTPDNISHHATVNPSVFSQFLGLLINKSIDEPTQALIYSQMNELSETNPMQYNTHMFHMLQYFIATPSRSVQTSPTVSSEELAPLNTIAESDKQRIANDFILFIITKLQSSNAHLLTENTQANQSLQCYKVATGIFCFFTTVLGIMYPFCATHYI